MTYTMSSGTLNPSIPYHSVLGNSKYVVSDGRYSLHAGAFPHTLTHTYTVLTAIIPGAPPLASCCLNSPPFTPKMCFLLGQA